MALVTKQYLERRLDDTREPAHPRRLELPDADVFPWDKVALGYELDPNGDDPDEVGIVAGEIDRVAVAQAAVTVADDNYIYVRRTRTNDTMLVAAAASVPADDATYKYYRLYRVTVTDGVASIQNIYRPFDIESGGGLPSGGTDGQLLQRDASLNAVWGWGRMKTI